MSLTDLKRRKKSSPKKKVSIEDFIEDANNYAFGQPSAVSQSRKKRSNKSDTAGRGIDKHTTKIYKHATFSLTHQTIDILDKVSAESKIAKSRLIRKLINDFAEKTAAEQDVIITTTHD